MSGSFLTTQCFAPIGKPLIRTIHVKDKKRKKQNKKTKNDRNVRNKMIRQTNALIQNTETMTVTLSTRKTGRFQLGLQLCITLNDCTEFL